MKTEVVMKREMFGEQISQKSKSEMFSATDLVRAGNKFRKENGMINFNLSQFLNQPNIKVFIDHLGNKFGCSLIKGRGRGSHTWVHPYLFIDIALAISPDLKIEVYEWIYDSLIKYRNDSGDSYKKMCGALWNNCTNKSTFSDGIKKTAELIKKYCQVDDWNTANESQLELRDKMHENISLLCDVLRDNNKAVLYGIKKTIEC